MIQKCPTAHLINLTIQNYPPDRKRPETTIQAHQTTQQDISLK